MRRTLGVRVHPNPVKDVPKNEEKTTKGCEKTEAKM